MTIDTLEYVKKLEAVGVDRRHDEAHAQAIRDTLAPQLASKADLDAAVARLEGKTDTAVSRLDAIETRHPSHDPDVRSRLTDIAIRLGLLRTGGSDWHGDPEPGEPQGALGSQEVPLEWLERLDRLRAELPAAAAP